MAISFQKIQESAPGLVNLSKLSRVELSKKGLDTTKAKVVFMADHSGSFGWAYKDGSIQRFMEKILAISTGLDDDGDIDFFVFDTNAANLGVISLNDYEGSIARMTAGRHMGTTDYAAAFHAVASHFGFTAQISAKKSFFGSKSSTVPTNSLPADIPVYVIFLTDGGPNSKPAARKALVEVANYPIFWKFVSIGAEDMSFLQELDDLKERFIDNADYKHLGSFDNMTDKELFTALLDEYPEYLAEARVKGLIV